ncbi:hypothetical protein PIB30_090712 [Stylosanthes scabra]|uniref:Uncharacterized protein n=1 Tax=Stylosanthes scabra TaxID=79078 RepID=A0ABU6ZT02_9FABA|nr:hypothetical protein [Stylosanthes scabra]
MRNRKVVVENHSLDDEPNHVAILTLCHPIMGHPIGRIEMFYPHNGMDFRHIVIQDTFYLDTENTQSFYAFGHHYLSTDYSIIHIYGLANKIGEMKMRMYSSSSAQWSVEQDAPSFIHYFDGAPLVCNGVVHWINKAVEERQLPRSIVTYSLNTGTWNEVLVSQEAGISISSHSQRRSGTSNAPGSRG